MSVNIYDKDTQTLTEVAGTGTVEFGASTVRTGKVTIPAGTSGGRFSITYDSPMNDTDYVFDFQISYINSEDLNNNVNVLFNSKKTTGADLWIFGSPSDKIIINYTAFKLHTVEGLEELETAVDSLQTLGTEVTHSWQGTVSALATTYSTNYTLPTGGKWLVIAEYELNYSTHNASGVYNLTLTDAQNVSGYGAPNGNLGKNMHVYSGGTVVTAGAAFYANDEYLNYPLTIWIKGYKIGV